MLACIVHFIVLATNGLYVGDNTKTLRHKAPLPTLVACKFYSSVIIVLLILLRANFNVMVKREPS